MIPQWMIDKCMEQLESHNIEGFVQGKGPLNASLMFVGEAPGTKEIERGKPFVGQAGQHLTRFLNLIGIEKDEVYITSAFRSRPYKEKRKTLKSGEVSISKSNRPPTQKELLAHAPILDYQIETINPEIIVTLGNVSLKRLLGPNMNISAVHGKLINSPIFRVHKPFQEPIQLVKTPKSYNIFPMYHPAAVIYRRTLMKTIEEDFQELAKHL